MNTILQILSLFVFVVAASNNCILRGGDFGFITVPFFFRQDLGLISNVVVKGFTFEAQVQYGIFAASRGDIRFQDCIFTVRY
jgi:hypothetical protein